MKGAYKTIIVFFLIDWAIASFHVNETKWLTWKKQHHKEYASTVEEEMRRHIWNENMHYILKHNSGQMSFQMELNEFADRSAHEMVGATTLIGEMEKRYPYHNEFQYAPASFDWRQKGAVPPVHNQGQLGDPVAFAVTDCVGSYHMIQTGRLVSLSVQETSDCCTHGHFATNVLGCIKQLGGLCSEADYPHITGKCQSSSCHVAAQIKGSVSVRPGNETDLQLSVLRNPVLVLIDASHISFQLYRTGVYEESKCSATRLDHALLLVGYGSMSGRDYWICKNSWGTSWGMQGYVLIARNKNNMCGIATAASLPI